MIRVYAYDYDLRAREEMLGQLRGGLDLIEETGYDVVYFSDRNAMLRDIADHRGEDCLAFVDLQRHERLDTAYAGHRLIETIRRHPSLLHCRPIAFTAYGYPDVIDLVNKHGAYGLISKLWLDALRDRAELETLHGVLERLVSAEPRPIQDQDQFFARSSGRNRELEHELEQHALYEVFADAPAYLTEPSFWPMIRHLAVEHLGLTAVAHLTHAEFPSRETNTYTKRLEAMPKRLAPAQQVGDRVHHYAAQGLLQRVPHRRIAPDESVSLLHLARVQRVAGFAAHQDELDADASRILQLSWLDADALSTLRLVVGYLPPPRGRQDHHIHTAVLETTLAELAPDSGGQALVPPLIRAVNGILDTKLALDGL